MEISFGLDWSVYTCLTQLYGGRDMYNLLHKDQLHVSALFIGHVVDLYVINYTYLYHHIVVLDKYTHFNLVYYKHNGDDEPYDHLFFLTPSYQMFVTKTLT